MATREDILRKDTFKDDAEDVGRRVFYTLTDKKEVELYRTQKAIAGLIELLRQKNVLSEDELDELLFGLVR